jgi:hypothetical protein
MPVPSIDLRVQCGGMHWRLQPSDALEVWRGTILLGTLSGHVLAVLIEQQMAAAEMLGWLKAAPSGTPPPPASPLARPPASPPHLPPRHPFDELARAQRRARRRTRK